MLAALTTEQYRAEFFEQQSCSFVKVASIKYWNCCLDKRSPRFAVQKRIAFSREIAKSRLRKPVPFMNQIPFEEPIPFKTLARAFR